MSILLNLPKSILLNFPMSILLSLHPDTFLLHPKTSRVHLPFNTPPSLPPTPLSSSSETPGYSGRGYRGVHPAALNLSSGPTGNTNQDPLVLHLPISSPVFLLCPIISSLRVLDYFQYPRHYQGYQSSPKEVILIHITF